MVQNSVFAVGEPLSQIVCCRKLSDVLMGQSCERPCLGMTTLLQIKNLERYYVLVKVLVLLVERPGIVQQRKI